MYSRLKTRNKTVYIFFSCRPFYPSHELARNIHNLPSPITSTFIHYVRNSFEFGELIKTKELEELYVQILFDVLSVFTSICKEKLEVHMSFRYKLLYKILQYLFGSSYFNLIMK